MKTDVKLPGDEPDGKEPDDKKDKKPVHLDFSKKPDKDGDSPFQKAASLKKRLKLFLWGDSGAGKTTLALQFPKPVVIDLEGGTDHYGGQFPFDVLRAVTPDEVMEAVDWLSTNDHPYRTLVIDPITVHWDSLQKKWSDIFLKRNKGSKGYKHEFYDLQPKDWLTIKSEFKELIRKLIALDMNVIVTAREKTKYKEGSFMVAIGETFDGEKGLPYMFDTIVRMFIDEKGRHMGMCVKDRSNRLPNEEFECTYAALEKYFGKQHLNRKPKQVEYSTSEQKERILKYVGQFGASEEQLTRRLAAYGAETIDELTRENADVIIAKFETAVAAKKTNTNEKKEKPHAKD